MFKIHKLYCVLEFENRLIFWQESVSNVLPILYNDRTRHLASLLHTMRIFRKSVQNIQGCLQKQQLLRKSNKMISRITVRLIYCEHSSPKMSHVNDLRKSHDIGRSLSWQFSKDTRYFLIISMRNSPISFTRHTFNGSLLFFGNISVQVLFVTPLILTNRVGY